MRILFFLVLSAELPSGQEADVGTEDGDPNADGGEQGREHDKRRPVRVDDHIGESPLLSPPGFGVGLV